MSIPTINLLTDNTTYLNTTKSNKFYSSKLLNYVEPIEIAGYLKTVFYSELNTNFNVGDRVFILNGNYDSNDFIKKNKYTKYTDGYRVLGVDGCRIIIDMEYTGVLPYENISLDNFIKITHISTQREFDYVNSIKVPISPTSVYNDLGLVIGGLSSISMMSKFSGGLFQLNSTSTLYTAVLYSDNIIYCDNIFNGSTYYNGISTPGFYIRVDSIVSNWVNITQQIEDNNIIAINTQYPVNGNIYNIGEDIEYGNLSFKQRNVYKYNSGSWEIDIKYKQSLISKNNFRYGTFKGNHNDGIFGTNIKNNNWNNAVWNSGIFVNSLWNSGIVNSKSSLGEKSFITNLKNSIGSTYSLPVQTIDFSNNNEFGYNYFIDSNFYKGYIKNGNFENTNIGISSTYSSVDIYFGATHSYDVISDKGLFKLCDIKSSTLNGSQFVNSDIYNSTIINSKIINSQVSESIADKSKISDKDGIKIISADIWSYTPDNTTTRGLLKLFISDDDIRELNFSDTFYITNINKEYILSSLTDDQKILLNIENKYIIDSYFNTEISSSKIIVSISSKNDNRYKVLAQEYGTSVYGDIFIENNPSYASINIDIDTFGFYSSLVGAGLISTQPISSSIVKSLSFVKSTIYSFSPIFIDNINSIFSETYIHNLDFKSGYLNNSEWISGDNINYTHNRIVKNNNKLDISYNTMDSIKVGLYLNTKMNQNIDIPIHDIFEGDNVWLNSINLSYGSTQSSISGRYKVIGISTTPTIKYVYLKTMDNLTFNTGTYSVIGAEGNTYLSINKFQINKSVINNGLFKNTSIKSSEFLNLEFDNTDRFLNINNTKKLRFINIVFKDTDNKINSGVIYKSHFINDNWYNGIIYNSIWNGSTFNSGTFKSSTWNNGIFNNGSFIDSNGITLVTEDYESSSIYKSWINGTFNLGEFYNSSWINGTFNNGRFYNSDWYSGVWNNGVLGSNNLSTSDTTFGRYATLSLSSTFSIWNNGVVDNAMIGGSGSVYWYDGKFNNGIFTSFASSSNNESIWYNGDFNGGKFTELARWKDGNFYKGKFLSHYGYKISSPTNPSTYSTDYGWENGKFYDGEFGNANLGTNSVWYNGDFKGGLFIGRFWNNGIFSKGTFIGSGTHSISNSPSSQIDEFNFANSFTSSYYGLWRNGYVTDSPQNVKINEIVSTKLVRKVDEKQDDNTSKLSNILWVNGTFSHKNATIEKSIWLNGKFINGTFNSSIFNAYVDREFTGSFSRSRFASTSSCIWENGIFDSTVGTGSFYVSNWESGYFNNGYMAGSKWKDGVWNYGFADNIYWENGLWRNGNWNGSPFNYKSLTYSSSGYYMIPGRDKDILLNTSLNIGTTSIHLINVFSASSPINILSDTQITADIDIISSNTTISNWIYDNMEEYTGIVSWTNGGFFNFTPNYGQLKSSDWEYNATYSINNTNGVSLDTNYTTKGGDKDNPTYIISNNYGYNDTQIDSPGISSRLYAKVGTSSFPECSYIFTSTSTVYEIELIISVELSPLVLLEIGIGDSVFNHGLTSSKKTYNTIDPFGNTVQAVDYRAKKYQFNYLYNTTSDSLNVFTSSSVYHPSISPTIDIEIGKQFYIKKTSNGIVRLLSAKITEKKTEYNNRYNNSLCEVVKNSNVILPNDPNIIPIANSDNGNPVSINYGNGVFRSGIWENGVWNNGYRSNKWFNKPDYYRMYDIIGIGGILSDYNTNAIFNSISIDNTIGNTYQVSIDTWTLSLKAIDLVSDISVGDKVAIGNIVAIDINEDRRIINDFFTVIGISDETINVRVVTNFPIRRIERDSPNHYIYITKTIWLSGTFLNGVFKGVWNNGLVKGNPMITLLLDTHFITGKFDGGHLVSSSIFDINYNKDINTSVVQNFEFIDNNIANIGEYKYLSWMDVNYLTSSITNINRENLNYIQPDSEIGDYVVPSVEFVNTYNIGGPITKDILESKSTFRNSYDYNTNNYRLGMKYTKYSNFIPNEGYFIKPFTNHLTGGLDMQNLTDDGWVIQDIGNTLTSGTTGTSTDYEILTNGTTEIDGSVNTNNINMLQIVNNNPAKIQICIGGIFYKTYTFINIKISNSNVDTIKNRYYLTEVDSYKLGITNSSTSKEGGEYSIKTGNLDILNADSPSSEYFYNKNDLGISIESWTYNGDVIFTNPGSIINFQSQSPLNSINLRFNNISFYEVDMIPFFKYAETDQIDRGIKVPYTAVAPYIDYNNTNFDFVGNVNLTFNSQGIEKQQPIVVINKSANSIGVYKEDNSGNSV